MAENTLTEAGSSYSKAVGFVYLFNLIVGTGALTMPLAFQNAGWLLSLIVIVLLAGFSYMTVTFVLETMATANATLFLRKKADIVSRRKESVRSNIGDSIDVGSDSATVQDEQTPLLKSEERDYRDDMFDIKERVELGKMAELYFNKIGVILFYLCMVLYLYGDLAIYAVAVPKSLRDVICTFKRNGSENASCASLTLVNSDPCWESSSLDRVSVYRMMVAVFAVTLGPFTFFNIQKTKYLQLFTTVTRWLAFMIMIVLTIIRLTNKQGQGHPAVADFGGIPNLFGVCVYSFMCHHSLPSLVTPIKNKSNLFIMVFIDFILILSFYSLVSFAGAFAFHQPKDIYTLSFLPDACDTKAPITNSAVLQYYLALFPVFTLSTSFPIISITLRNNLKTMFYREHRPFSWFIDRIIFPLAAIFLPFVIALATDEVEFLVGITGSYAGAAIQYVIPSALVLVSRRAVQADPSISTLKNRFTSPFKHIFWVILVFVWAFVAISFVTVNHILTEK
ncbi:transmembrane protein 104-like isoform X2 [Ostrea edulis]|uniref:transmembrane protein 104-like isoform X2 n=1 Tax=Ostrea edulis TaxID=37623 RepID=UPI0024AE98A2|nr:transmembrane protein 104-like isoform X2 [Ostrea edulis]